MRTALIIDRKLRRCWLFGQRMHHGPVGVAFIALGTLLAIHDRRDYRDWFRRT
jgi:hypothetical protein